MPEPGTIEPHEASQSMFEFQQTEVERLLVELRAHGFDADHIRDLQEKLENPTTVEIIGDDFSIHRNANQGFDLTWHQRRQAA